MELEQEVRRGREAAELLEHPLLVEAFGRMRAELHDAWHQSPARDIEAREMVYLSVKMLGKIEGFLKEFVATGKMASMQLKEGESSVRH